MITYEQMKKRGLFKEADYKDIINFMCKNNSDNDINNNKTYGKYFYNIGIQQRTDLDRECFYFLYNSKPCYYDFAREQLEITLSEDLKIKVKLRLADMIDFLKSNSALFEFKQQDGMYYEGDSIKFKSVLAINH